MVPSGQCLLLSNMEMALALCSAGMIHLCQSWALSVQSWEGTVWPGIGSFRPDIGPFSFMWYNCRGCPQSGALGIKRSSAYVMVRSVEHERIAIIARSRLIPIMTGFRKSRLPPPHLHAYPSPLPLSKPSPTIQGELWSMVYILYKQITRRGHYYASQLTQSSIEMPSAIAPIGLSIGQNTKTLSSLRTP